ncbi:hypothetical protein PT974_04497 [Cladobotryum mycophilum]|uniref:Uncharacterized protein n=1 Tax=Cladobotryum mycophilum TaxID=491253 RepID=A0ABR0SV46_9HYPO
MDTPSSSTTQMRCHLEKLSSDIIITIMTMLTRHKDLIHFLESYPRIKSIFNHGRKLILLKIVLKLIHPSNLDIALAITAIIHLKVNDTEDGKALINEIMFGTVPNYQDLCPSSLMDLFLLAEQVNYLANVYAAPEELHPDKHWKHAYYTSHRKDARHVREGEGTVVARFRCRGSECIAKDFWDLCYRTMKDKPPGRSDEQMAIIAREFYTWELQSRYRFLRACKVSVNGWVWSEVPNMGIEYFFNQLQSIFFFRVEQLCQAGQGGQLKELNRSHWICANFDGITPKFGDFLMLSIWEVVKVPGLLGIPASYWFYQLDSSTWEALKTWHMENRSSNAPLPSRYATLRLANSSNTQLEGEDSRDDEGNGNDESTDEN